jgi:sortase B
MPDIDIRKKYTYSKRRKKKKKQNPAVEIVSGLFPWSGDTASDVARKIVFLISITTLTVTAIFILNHYFGAHDPEDYPDYWNVDFNNESVGKIIWGEQPGLQGSSNTPVEVEILDRYRGFWEKNPDFVGFLSIDPYINYPVVQPRGDKPFDFYLNHNFDERPTTNGTIFACKFTEYTPHSRPNNAIIHGHNLLTKNNFQPLLNYLNTPRNDGFVFLQKNHIITFDTLFEPGRYKIFAVLQTNINTDMGEFYDFARQRSFTSREHFFEFVTEALDRSRYHTGVDLEYGDEILTLSTCEFSMGDDVRLVIIARRVRPTELAVMNPETFVNLTGGSNPGRNAEGLMRYKMFDRFYRNSNRGNGWAGREWDISRINDPQYADWLVTTGRA